jgi:hypothetical protein
MCLCPSRHAGKYCQENIGDCSCLNGGTCYNSTVELFNLKNNQCLYFSVE